MITPTHYDCETGEQVEVSDGNVIIETRRQMIWKMSLQDFDRIFLPLLELEESTHG